MLTNKSQKKEPAIIEPVSVPDVYVTRLIRIEELSGGNLRFTFVADQEITEGTVKTKVGVIRLRIIMNAGDVLEASKAAFIAASGISGVIGETVISSRH